MTKLGEMLVEDGIKKGIEQGIEQGEEKKAIKVAKKAINRGLDNETIIDLTGLSEKEINAIRIALNE
ncbi:hypothetical protein CBU02nite_10300 [Clostridium butyricum]|uniref:Transposase n=1 Tax=Clostridium butyricum TaxID=1492 RepID=A0A512TJT7_CLOBU|nr:hypothetical protein CBU02nite_10300 [Clostridium butyricum]